MYYIWDLNKPRGGWTYIIACLHHAIHKHHINIIHRPQLHESLWYRKIEQITAQMLAAYLIIFSCSGKFEPRAVFEHFAEFCNQITALGASSLPLFFHITLFGSLKPEQNIGADSAKIVTMFSRTMAPHKELQLNSVISFKAVCQQISE